MVMEASDNHPSDQPNDQNSSTPPKKDANKVPKIEPPAPTGGQHDEQVSSTPRTADTVPCHAIGAKTTPFLHYTHHQHHQHALITYPHTHLPTTRSSKTIFSAVILIVWLLPAQTFVIALLLLAEPMDGLVGYTA